MKLPFLFFIWAETWFVFRLFFCILVSYGYIDERKLL